MQTASADVRPQCIMQTGAGADPCVAAALAQISAALQRPWRSDLAVMDHRCPLHGREVHASQRPNATNTPRGTAFGARRPPVGAELVLADAKAL
jgi:hypothetical protein